MPVNRYKGRRYIASGNNTDFPFWIFVSAAIHLIPAIVIVLLPRVSHRNFRPPVYQVELLPRQEAAKVEEAQINEEQVSRQEPEQKPLLKTKEIKSKANSKSQKKDIAVPKPQKKEAAKPDDAIKKMRERLAADEAVEKIRKKVKSKETVSAKAPGKVYFFEELDDEMKAYYATISQIIQNAWILPDVLRNKGYKTVISIHVLKDGTVQSLWMEKKSGNSSYDETAEKSIKKVGALPSLPKGWKKGYIDLGFNFEGK